MNDRFDLTDNLLDEALQVQGASAPADLRASIRQAVVSTPQGWSLRLGPGFGQLRPVTILMVVLAALLLAFVAIGVGSRLLEDRRLTTSVLPSPSSAINTPAATPTGAPTPSSPPTFSLWQGMGQVPGELRFAYRIPDGVTLNIETSPSTVGFAEGSDGLGYGSTRPIEAHHRNLDARGVVVSDVTGAFPWGAHDEEPARDAAGFWDLLKSDAPSSSPKYLVSSLTESEVGGYAALEGEIELTSDYSFAQLEWGGPDDHEVYPAQLYGRSHLIVADVEQRVIMFQVWVAERADGTARDREMEAWLPIAQQMIGSVALQSSAPDATPPADGTFSLWAWQTPTTGELRFEFQEPQGFDFAMEAHPSSVGFDAGARGVVVADLTGTTLFGVGQDMPAGGQAVDFVESLRSHHYDLDQITPTSLAGYPGLEIGIASWPPYAWLEWGWSTPDLSLAKPNRLIVADVGARVVMAQIWVDRADPESPSANATRLDAWLPTAIEFINSLRLVAADEGLLQ